MDSSEVTISTVEGKLYSVNFKVAEAEARLTMFTRLKSKGLCTRDVYKAARIQAKSRRTTHGLDLKAISRDMNCKIKDASTHLSRLRMEKAKLRLDLHKALKGKSYSLRN